jgi:HAD superfamily hydrolase (TIGR01484 family)
MSDRLLICTDLDRTLIPNGPESESDGVRRHFARLCARPEVTLAYVTGRHRALVESAISNYSLPPPDYVIADVGTTIYRVGPGHPWERQHAWDAQIAVDWNGRSRADIKSLLVDLPSLRLQATAKQNDHKLSYYVPMHSDHRALTAAIRARLEADAVRARLIWSDDEPAGIGLLDVVPERASKLHAIEALMHTDGFALAETLFAGDSGNDLEVLASTIPSVLVANSQPQVQAAAKRLAQQHGTLDALYIARGGFMETNGNYGAGILEGIAHYHPECIAWIDVAGGPGR